MPIAESNGNEALLALVNGKFVNIHIPYPMGFFSKNVDGRIDDPKRRLEREGALDDDRHAHRVSR